MKETIKKILPDPVLEAARWGADGIHNLKLWPQARFHPWRRGEY